MALGQESNARIIRMLSYQDFVPGSPEPEGQVTWVLVDEQVPERVFDKAGNIIKEVSTKRSSADEPLRPYAVTERVVSHL